MKRGTKIALGAAAAASIVTLAYLLAREKEVGTTSAYVCPYCQDIFPSAEARDNHIRQEHPEGPFICVICPEAPEFPTYDALLEHIAVNHPDNPPGPGDFHTCPFCDYIASSLEDLANHMNDYHPYWCSVCGAELESQEDLQRHLVEEHGFPPPDAAMVLGVEYLGWEIVPSEEVWGIPGYEVPIFHWDVTWECAVKAGYVVRIETAKRVYDSGADWHYITGLRTLGYSVPTYVPITSPPIFEVGRHVTRVNCELSTNSYGRDWEGVHTACVEIYGLSGEKIFPSPIDRLMPFPEVELPGALAEVIES